MKRQHLIAVAAFVSGLMVAPVGAQVTVDYNAGLGLRDVVDHLGAPLADGDEVRIGYFDNGFDIAANAGSLTALDSAWNPLDTTVATTIFGQPGRFADSVSTADTQFDNRRLNLWIFKTGDNSAPAGNYANVVAYGLYSSSAANWVVPPQGTLPPNNAILVTSSEVNQLYHGSADASHLQLAAVPEPSQIALVAGAFLLVFAVWRTHRNAGPSVGS